MADGWLIDQLSLETPGFWLAFSILSLPFVSIFVRRADVRYRPWIAAARWTLIPYAGLMAGGLSPRFLGLSKINWLTTLSLGVVLLCSVLAVSGAVRIAQSFDRSSIQYAEIGALPPSAPPARWTGSVLILLWIGAEQFHWCFVRGALWELMVDLPTADAFLPSYRAMWVATLFVLPEIWLQPVSLTQHLLKSSALIVTGVAFYYTRNFWLCWAMHAGMWLLIGGLYSPR